MLHTLFFLNTQLRRCLWRVTPRSLCEPVLSCSPLRCTLSSRADVQSGSYAIKMNIHHLMNLWINRIITVTNAVYFNYNLISQCWHPPSGCNFEITFKRWRKYTLLPIKAAIGLSIYTDLKYFITFIAYFTPNIVSLGRKSWLETILAADYFSMASLTESCRERFGLPRRTSWSPALQH